MHTDAHTDDPSRAVDQTEALAALADPSLPGVGAGLSIEPTDERPDAVSRIDTHGAHVFLHAGIALKIKRAVHFSYMDNRRLERRRALCERELALNRPALPDLYLDVLPLVRRADGSHALGGEGTPIEWVLRMRRFDEKCVLDSRARAGELTPTLARFIGADLALWHAALAPVETADGQTRLLDIVTELDREFDALRDRLSPALVEPLLRELRTRFDATGALLDERAALGFVRRCHGDLHLRNLLEHRGRIVPFDALEFDERLATTDVLYDLAFLVMDLGDRQLFEAQNALFNAWLCASDERHLDALAAFAPMLACRALIRAMTALQDASPTDTGGESRQEQALGYLHAALTMLQPTDPRLILVGGLSGSGKSTLCGSLAVTMAPPPGCVLLRSDAERKAMAGVAETDRLPDEAYERGPNARLYSRLRHRASRALAAGATVMVDATFLDPAEREGFSRLADVAGVQCDALWLEVDEAIARRRIGARRDDVSDADIAVFERQREHVIRPADWTTIDAGGLPAQTASRATLALAHPVRQPTRR